MGYEGSFYWSDIETLESYRAAHSDVLSGKVRVRIPGKRWGELWVDREARFHPTVSLEGSIVLMNNAIIEQGATLEGDTTVGSGCWIRPGATIKQSILFPGSTVGDGAYLEECIVGPCYEVRPGEQIRGGALVCGAH